MRVFTLLRDEAETCSLLSFVPMISYSYFSSFALSSPLFYTLFIKFIIKHNFYLQTLAKIFLDLEIHDENGHCSVDDAVVTMRLLKYKLSRG